MRPKLARIQNKFTILDSTTASTCGVSSPTVIPPACSAIELDIAVEEFQWIRWFVRGQARRGGIPGDRHRCILRHYQFTGDE